MSDTKDITSGDPLTRKQAEKRAKKRAWYEANKARVAEYNKAWQEANGAAKAAQQKARREANLDESRAKEKAKYQADPTKGAARQKAYRRHPLSSLQYRPRLRQR